MSVAVQETPVAAPDVEVRVQTVEWPRVAADLDGQGWAVLPKLLASAECREVAGLYEGGRFRSTVVMARHGFGQGEYKYFAYPLPDLVGGFRGALYPHLVSIANRWNETMGIGVRFPADHAAFLDRCHAAGQTRVVSRGMV